MSARYPVLFGFRDLVAGKGFVAGVATEGRALMEEEEDGGITWVYGVNPGGLAADAPTKGQAFAEFKKAYLSVLFDFASLSPSFGAFKSSVEQFFNETNEPTAAEWAEAVEQVRDGVIKADWLRTARADRELSVQVVLVAGETASQTAHPAIPAPSANALDEEPAMAAAAA